MAKTTAPGLEFGPIQKTRFDLIDFQEQGQGNWRLIDAATGATTGPRYPTRQALVDDLGRVAWTRGYAKAAAVGNPFGPDGPPNLDDFSIDVADFLDVADVFELYAKYLRNRAHAMRARSDGTRSAGSGVADICEAQADAIYRALPKWARW